MPVEWRYYLVMPGDASTGKGGSSEQRHMISITTTVEQSLAERARKSDRDLADRLELIKPVKTAPAIAKTAPKQEFKGEVGPRASFATRPHGQQAPKTFAENTPALERRRR